MLLLIIVMATAVVVGLAAIALAEPRPLHDRKLRAGWW
jgi:hypothetical protein